MPRRNGSAPLLSNAEGAGRRGARLLRYQHRHRTQSKALTRSKPISVRPDRPSVVLVNDLGLRPHLRRRGFGTGWAELLGSPLFQLFTGDLPEPVTSLHDVNISGGARRVLRPGRGRCRCHHDGYRHHAAHPSVVSHGPSVASSDLRRTDCRMCFPHRAARRGGYSVGDRRSRRSAIRSPNRVPIRSKTLKALSSGSSRRR